MLGDALQAQSPLVSHRIGAALCLAGVALWFQQRAGTVTHCGA
jgi:hypothetical protein